MNSGKTECLACSTQSVRQEVIGTYACIIRRQTREAACTPTYIMYPGGGTVRINGGNESELERRFSKASAVGEVHVYSYTIYVCTVYVFYSPVAVTLLRYTSKV